MSSPPPDSGSPADATMPYDPSRIRNIAVVGCAGADSFGLIRRLARFAGADLDVAHDENSGEALSAVGFAAGDFRLTLVGIADVAERDQAMSAARACDALMLVVSPWQRIPAAAIAFWDAMVERGVPGAVIVALVDSADPGLDDAIEACQEALGESTTVLPVHLPLLSDDLSVAGLIDLITLAIQDFSGTSMATHPAEPVHLDLIDDYRRALAEIVIAESADDSLLEAAVQGEPVDVEVLSREADSAIRRGRLHPLLVAADDPPALGSARVMDVITHAFPSPTDRPLPPVTAPDGGLRTPLTADADGPLCAQILGVPSVAGSRHRCLIRIFSGSLHTGQRVHLHGPHPDGVDLRGVGRIAQVEEIVGLRGGDPQITERVGAGHIVEVTGLTGASVGETISELSDPLVIAEPHSFD
jgi:elongation factor G